MQKNLKYYIIFATVRMLLEDEEGGNFDVETAKSPIVDCGALYLFRDGDTRPEEGHDSRGCGEPQGCLEPSDFARRQTGGLRHVGSRP